MSDDSFGYVYSGGKRIGRIVSMSVKAPPIMGKPVVGSNRKPVTIKGSFTAHFTLHESSEWDELSYYG